MLCFKAKNEERYLVTNYKVMYSTLTKQQNIDQYLSKKLNLKILFNQLHLNNAQFYLLVRDPYDRTESFFKDKFRQSPKRKEKKGEWQNTHKIFFPYLGLNASMPNSEITDKLLNVSFNEFLSHLGDVFKVNRHLWPQHWATGIRTARLPYFNLPLRFQKVFKMESESDLNDLAKLFKIDLDVINNSTKTVSEPIFWGKSELEMVEKIYKKDFELFGYMKKSFKSLSKS